MNGTQRTGANSKLTANLAPNHDGFRHADLSFTISLRGFPAGDFSVVDFLQLQYPFLRLSQIRSVFAFHECFTRLYGGRSFNAADVLRTGDLEEIYRQNIGFYIPLTNHFVDQAQYDAALPFLEMHHREGNTVTCVSDSLAKWVRRDFPLFEITASVIKNLVREEEIRRALEIYDKVVLPPGANNDMEMLARFPDKDRLCLFANNNCLYTCTSPICYRAISRAIRDAEDPYVSGGTAGFKKGPACRRMTGKPVGQESLGYVAFDLTTYREMGYRYFKLIPPQAMRSRQRQAEEGRPSAVAGRVRSLPRAGRIEEELPGDFVVSQELKDRFYTSVFLEAVTSASVEERAVLSHLDTTLSAFEGGATLKAASQALSHRLSVPSAAVHSALHLLVSLGVLVHSPPRFDRSLFIVAAPRSGSSLLFETLAASANLWSIGGESHGIFEGIPDLHPIHRNYDSNRLEKEAASAPVVARLKERFARELRSAHGTRFPDSVSEHSSHRVRFLEKTPKNALRIPFLKAAFPDARFVYLTRDAGPNISSIMDGWRSGRFVTYPELPGWAYKKWSFLLPPGWRDLGLPSLAKIAAFQWQAANATIIRDLEELSRQDWIGLKYENLIRDPSAEVARLCSFLEMDMDRGLQERLGMDLPLSGHTLTPPNSKKWRQNRSEIEPFLPTLEPLVSRISSIMDRCEPSIIPPA